MSRPALVVLFFLALSAAGPLAAAPPPEANLSFSAWFESLRQRGNGLPCCSIADCRITRARVTADGYDALIEGEWIAIPDDSRLDRFDNPTGHAVVCYRRFHNDNGDALPVTVFCFVPPSQT